MKLDFNTKKLAGKINNNASIFIRKVVLDGMKGLIRQSPKDTGRFQANWSTSVNLMHTETTEETKVNLGKQSKEIADYKLGQTMFLHNNLVYAIPLEYGHSKQAPKGWIRNTARLMQKKLNEIKNLL
jgi:hypothetical protein